MTERTKDELREALIKKIDLEIGSPSVADDRYYVEIYDSCAAFRALLDELDGLRKRNAQLLAGLDQIEDINSGADHPCGMITMELKRIREGANH